MVLSTNSLNIRERLDSLFCGGCGYRIGWVDQDTPNETLNCFCETCAKEDADHWEQREKEKELV